MTHRSSPGDRSGPRRPPAGALSVAFTAGFTLLGAMALGYYGGRYLDSLAGTGPWLSLVGFILGVTAGFRVLIRDVLRPGAGPDLRGDGRSRSPEQDEEKSEEPDRG